MGVIIENNRVAKLDYLPSGATLIHPQSLVARQVATEIRQYFCDPQFKFNLEILLQGTVLQKKIWHELQKIPVGTTKTYGELARKLGTGPRVVGNACGRNPVPIIIPCHRVVAASSLGGYCGGKDSERFMEIKKLLLKHEK